MTEISKTITKKSAQEEYNQPHYLLKCPYCGTELIVKRSDLHKEMFEPKEEEVEGFWFEGEKLHKEVKKELVSSDPTKDVYKDIKCCNCGHVWDEPVRSMYKNFCEPNGEKPTQHFALNKKETEAARKFREKHDHSEELLKDKKVGFTTLGQQFTYEITPGGLGNTVVIKCNYCGAVEDITDIDSW